MTTHLCLVSDQPVPCLTPLLDPALAVRSVLLVHAPERARQAAWLAAALQRHGIAAELHALADAYDLPGLRRELSALAGRHPAGFVANITGGTKLMTLAAWEVFARPTDRLYYVDIRRDSLRWLRPEAPEQPVADRVQLETYLVAHGLRIHPKRGLHRELPDSAALKAARQLALRLAPLKKKLGSDGGTWLEELVFAEAAALRAQDRKIQDIARQFVVDNAAGQDQRVENEIDIAILRDNTLFLVECKTGKAGRGPDAADAIYKLAQLVDDLGGLRGRGILVSSELVSDAVKARARHLRIDLVDRSAFGNLGGALANLLAVQRSV